MFLFSESRCQGEGEGGGDPFTERALGLDHSLHSMPCQAGHGTFRIPAHRLQSIPLHGAINHLALWNFPLLLKCDAQADKLWDWARCRAQPGARIASG